MMLYAKRSRFRHPVCEKQYAVRNFRTLTVGFKMSQIASNFTVENDTQANLEECRCQLLNSVGANKRNEEAEPVSTSGFEELNTFPLPCCPGDFLLDTQHIFCLTQNQILFLIILPSYHNFRLDISFYDPSSSPIV